MDRSDPVTCAIFTIGKDERFHLPQWIRYYSQHFAYEDMYVLDHESADPDVQTILDEFEHSGGNVFPIRSDVVFDHDWLLETAHATQSELLCHYDYVLYTDTDEIVIPVDGTLGEFLENADKPSYRCIGYEVIEDTVARHGMYDKTLLASHSLRWSYGWHDATPYIEPSGELFLYHLHRMDYGEAWAKNRRWAQHRWDANAIAGGFSIQNQIDDEERFREWFYDTKGQPREPLHERIAAIL